MPYKCDICEKEYIQKRNLTRHVQEKHFSNKQWSCSKNKCSSKFFRRSNLVRHLCLTHRYSTSKARRVALYAKVNNFKQYTSTSAYDGNLGLDESILDLHTELNAIEEEEAIRAFDLEPYEFESEDMRQKIEHIAYDDEYANYLDCDSSDNGNVVDDRYPIDNDGKYDINVPENNNVSSYVYKYSDKDDDNKEIREICSYQD